MKVLITGGLGFIGSHVASEFLDHGHQVVVTRFGAEEVAAFLKPHWGGRLSVEAVDIASPHAVIDACRRHDVESIVHLAGPPIGAISAIEEYRINMSGLLNVVEAAKIVGARRVSIASSVAVYLGLEGPLHEDMRVPLTAAHTIEAFKKAEELLGQHLANAGGVDLVSLRLASIYGPLYRTRRHWPAQLVHAAVSNQPAPLAIPGLPPFYRDDHATDLCYVTDCARAVRLVHMSDQLQHKVYNVGGGQNVTYGHIADIAASIFPDLGIDMMDGTGSENWVGSTMDLQRINKDVGYEPCFTIRKAMERYAAWLKEGHPF